MKRAEKIESLLNNNLKDISNYKVYNTPQTIEDFYIGAINKVLCYIELYGYGNTYDSYSIKSEADKFGLDTVSCGRDLYICVKQ